MLVLPIVHPVLADTPNTPQTLRQLAIKATVYATLNSGKTPGSTPISANLFGNISALEIDAFGMIRLDLPLFGSSFRLIL